MRGQLVFDGGIGGGGFNVFDYSNTTGATLHIENDGVDDILGSTSGDTLLGPAARSDYPQLVWRGRRVRGQRVPRHR